MVLSCCMWVFSGSEAEVMKKIAAVGFERVDVRLDAINPEGASERIGSLGLRVPCIAASFGMPEGAALDSADENAVTRALAHTEKTLEVGAALGATTAYVVPEMDGSKDALMRYARALVRAAEGAAKLGLKLGIEHFPGRSLPTAAGTLEFLTAIGHPNLYLLFDIGHAQISGEDPAAVVESAGERLGYVHLDDNDGRNDQHLGLLDGVLTEETLRRTFTALENIGYDGAVSLELSAQLSDPLAALEKSREVVEEVAARVRNR